MIGVLWFNASAGKADLARMVGELRATLRQQHVQSVGAIDERHEHGGRRRCTFTARQAETVAQAERARRGWLRQALDQPGTLSGRRKIEQWKTHGDPSAERRLGAMWTR